MLSGILNGILIIEQALSTNCLKLILADAYSMILCHTSYLNFNTTHCGNHTVHDSRKVVRKLTDPIQCKL